MFDDGEPEGPEYAFGNTAPMPDDAVPMHESDASTSAFRRTNAEGVKRFSRNIGRTLRKQNPYPVGFPAKSPFSSSEPEAGPDPSHSHTFTEIPENYKPRHPLYGFNPDIVEDSPESEAEDRVGVENVISYSQQDVDDVQSAAQEMEQDVQKLMMTQGAALLMSYQDASANTAAILKDALDIDIEIDDTVPEVLAHLMRLNTLSYYADRMSLPDSIRSQFMYVLTEKIAEDAHSSIQKTEKSEKYSSTLRNLYARMKGITGENAQQNTPEAAEVANQIGVVRRRSSGGGSGARKGQGVDAPVSESPEDQHDFNERQNAGVRFG